VKHHSSESPQWKSLSEKAEAGFLGGGIAALSRATFLREADAFESTAIVMAPVHGTVPRMDHPRLLSLISRASLEDTGVRLRRCTSGGGLFRKSVRGYCFTGRDLVDWLVETEETVDRVHGSGVAQQLLEVSLIRPLRRVLDTVPFLDEPVFYQFNAELITQWKMGLALSVSQ